MSQIQKRPLSPLALVLIVSLVFFALFLIVTGAMMMSKNSSLSRGSSGGANLFAEDSVGVIELNGVIMDSKMTQAKLERFEEDKNIKAVVLRINSPGGAVAPSQEIYQAVQNYKKPIVASMSSVAASGGYYVAVGTKKIWANPGTITGSIGVIMEFANLEKLYEWAKVRRYVIKTGKFKDAGSEYREMSPEERELLQGMINDVLVQFKQAVSTGRKLTMADVDRVADGRIFSGSQAKAAHLVDELGSLQDAANDAAKMAGIKGKPKLIYPERKGKKWIEYLLDERGGEEGESSAGILGLFSRAVLGSPESAQQGAGLSSLITGLAPGVYWLWTGGR